jgi:hypothetical protein
VSKLAAGGGPLWTVSRSRATESRPNIAHITKQNLDQPGGSTEFQDVLRHVVLSSPSTAIYFTLGQHKGVNPFVRNLQAAENFATALEQSMTLFVPPQQDRGWKVILTGTDATRPSTHPDGKTNIGGQEFSIPAYRISAYNYTYAMSKLGQYYRIGQAIATLTGKSEIAVKCETVVARIRKHVEQAGENGNYDPDSAQVKMEELDEWSRQVDLVLLPQLQSHFSIAKNISICYTPLHAHPWTEQALAQNQLDPRAYVLEQITKRFQNAISIEQAVAVHFA